jgi:hypothetical protein
MYSDEILLARDIVETLAIEKGSVFTPTKDSIEDPHPQPLSQGGRGEPDH